MVRTNASGAASFNVPAGQNVTATATSTSDGTSPFSNCAAGAADATDVLTLSNVVPSDGSNLSEQDLKANGLKATVTYLLASKPNADLVLRVFDQFTRPVADQTQLRLTIPTESAVPRAFYRVILRVNGAQALRSPEVNLT